MSCTICKSDKSTIAYYGKIRGSDEATILSCSDCGVRYLKDMQEFDYNKGYREEVGPDELARHIPGILSIAPVTDLMDKFVVDIGCSEGTYLKGISNYTKNIVGVEPNESQRENLEFECFSSIQSTLKKYQGKVDVVTLWHVIEHISDPVNFLLQASLLLNKDGKIYLSTPNTNDVLMNLLDDYYGFFYRAWHTHYYDTFSLYNLCACSGLEPLLSTTKQSFGIGNILGWLKDKKPCGKGIELPHPNGLDFIWKTYLENHQMGDTIYMILRKEEIH